MMKFFRRIKLNKLRHIRKNRILEKKREFKKILEYVLAEVSDIENIAKKFYINGWVGFERFNLSKVDGRILVRKEKDYYDKITNIINDGENNILFDHKEHDFLYPFNYVIYPRGRRFFKEWDWDCIPLSYYRNKGEEYYPIPNPINDRQNYNRYIKRELMPLMKEIVRKASFATKVLKQVYKFSQIKNVAEQSFTLLSKEKAKELDIEEILSLNDIDRILVYDKLGHVFDGNKFFSVQYTQLKLLLT